MKDKKKWVIGLLCTLVCIMAVGYALLAQQLNINGSASIDSTWKVEITNIQESEVVGKATSKVTPSYTSTTANFSVGLIQPGDSITYDVEISNLGTLDAKVDSINVVTEENDAIKYTTTGVVSGDKLGVGEKATLTIKVEYDSNVTSQPSVTTKDITITINYVQDLEDESSETSYDYVVGDVVTYNGIKFYVIENSLSTSSYVTLLKEVPLTVDEVNTYGAGHVNVGNNPDGVAADLDSYGGMAYYSSETVYESYDSVCSNRDYSSSEVKYAVDNWGKNNLDINDLVSDDTGYSIRLITRDELINNLGFTVNNNRQASSETPTWVYNYPYWTMSNRDDTSCDVWEVSATDGGWLNGSHITQTNYVVRPVINLLKSSI